MNRNTLIGVIVIILLVIAVVWAMFLRTNNEDQPSVPSDIVREDTSFPTLEESQRVAEEWIRGNAPTYVFDGMDLVQESGYALGQKGAYRYVFTFNSRHAGYGDRSGAVLAQVITPHNITVEVKNGVVASAVTDDQFDELNNESLVPKGGYQKG